MNKRTSNKRRSSRVAVAFVTAILVVLAIMPTVSANDVEWVEIQSSIVNDEFSYTSDIELKQLSQNGNYRLSITPTSSSVTVDVDNGVDSGSLYYTQGEAKIIEGTPEQIYTTLATEADLRTSYTTISFIRFMGANFVLYEAQEPQIEPFGGGLITSFFSGFSGVITGLATGVKDMFTALVFTNGQLSHFAKFGFLMMGLSLALGLGYFIIRKIRG